MKPPSWPLHNRKLIASEREAAELAAAQQEADRLKREAANWQPHNRKLIASSAKPLNWLPHEQEAERLKREAAELAAAQQEAERPRA